MLSCYKWDPNIAAINHVLQSGCHANSRLAYRFLDKVQLGFQKNIAALCFDIFEMVYLECSNACVNILGIFEYYSSNTI